MDPKQLAEKRFRLLVEQLRQEIGEEWGWHTEAARRLGISSSVLSHVLAERRGVGLTTVSRVVTHMGLKEAFFFDESLSEPDYRKFLSKAGSRRVVAEDDDTPGWLRFVELGLYQAYLARGLDEGQLEYARRARFKHGPPADPTPYMTICEQLLQQPVEKSAKEALEEAKKR